MFELFCQRLTAGGDFMWQRIAVADTLYDAIGICRDRSHGKDMRENMILGATALEVQVLDAETGLLCYRILQTGLDSK